MSFNIDPKISKSRTRKAWDWHFVQAVTALAPIIGLIIGVGLFKGWLAALAGVILGISISAYFQYKAENQKEKYSIYSVILIGLPATCATLLVLFWIGCVINYFDGWFFEEKTYPFWATVWSGVKGAFWLIILGFLSTIYGKIGEEAFAVIASIAIFLTLFLFVAFS